MNTDRKLGEVAANLDDMSDTIEELQDAAQEEGAKPRAAALDELKQDDTSGNRGPLLIASRCSEDLRFCLDERVDARCRVALIRILHGDGDDGTGL
jgi:hypothetical protein